MAGDEAPICESLTANFYKEMSMVKAMILAVLVGCLCVGCATTPVQISGTCTGAADCKVCKNCKYCAYCNSGGGSCGVKGSVSGVASADSCCK